MSGPTLGFLGSGHLASYTIAALRNGGHKGQITVSPRNGATAARLVSDHGCIVASSNQQLVDSAEIVVLSVRPHQLEDALTGLSLHAGQIVLSAVAGISIHQLRSMTEMPDTIIRFMPSSFIEAGDALYPIHPANSVVEGLLAPTGRVVVFEAEDQFEMATLASCSYAWIYELMDTLASWFEEAGWPAEIAREMAVRHVRGATTFALEHPDISLQDILSGIATDGTFTKAGLEHLRTANAFAPWSGALDHVHAKLRSAKN